MGVKLDARAARDNARLRGDQTYSTGRPCIHGHEPLRSVATGKCVHCNRVDVSTRQKANPEKKLAKDARYRNKHRVRLRRYRGNKAKKAANKAAYIARRLQATPKWADLKAIEAIYEECRRVTKKTRKRHEVDHIIPLRGKNICGLHVETNLQIITKKENRKKSNKF